MIQTEEGQFHDHHLHPASGTGSLLPNILDETTNLRRAVLEVPDDVRAAQEDEGLVEDYRNRPAYQQNDYLGWIGRAQRDATRDQRITRWSESCGLAGSTWE